MLGDADVAGAQGAPALAIAEVYEAHFPYVWRCLRGLGVRQDWLQDATHDVFLVVQRKLGQFDGKVRLTTWLYAIALRIARQYRERAARETARQAPEDQELDEAAAAPMCVETEVEAARRLELARRALDRLDDEKREAFVLACVEQLTAPEIASITGVPLNTVYSRIRAARRAFQAQIARLQASRRTP